MESVVDIREALLKKVESWWKSLSGYDKNYYVKRYEGGVVPVAALTEGAIIRLYFKVIEGLDKQRSFEKYHQIFN